MALNLHSWGLSRPGERPSTQVEDLRKAYRAATFWYAGADPGLGVSTLFRAF